MALMNAKAPVSERAPGSQPCCSSLQTSLQHTGGHQQDEPPDGHLPTAGGDTITQPHHVPSRPWAVPGPSTAESSCGSAPVVAGGLWFQPGPPCPEGCSPSCPGGLGELRLTLAQRPWGGSGWPSTLAGVCSPAEKPAGRDGNGAAWRRLLHICVCLCTRGTFRLLLLFKYFNASHLVSYFLKMDTSMSYTHISKCLCIGINTRSRKAQSDS